MVTTRTGRPSPSIVPALALVAGVSCAPGTETPGTPAPEPFAPVYLGTQTRLLDRDLVNFHVEMRGARSAADVADYARCVAAQYALIRGYSFARHLRTNVDEEGGLWRGDAVYTISATLPEGLEEYRRRSGGRDLPGKRHTDGVRLHD